LRVQVRRYVDIRETKPADLIVKQAFPQRAIRYPQTVDLERLEQFNQYRQTAGPDLRPPLR
jgi:hypothetical protein